MALTLSDICKFIFAIFLPPIGVLLERGCWHADLLINILLTILGRLPMHNIQLQTLTALGYLPGVLHAMFGHLSTQVEYLADTSDSVTSYSNTRYPGP
ncbi:Uncharacterized protein HZ326_21823 [Fusarium oxysporum f. sp. albedinis]|nr:Uncharacterized protein HZ326_21823 [Fusarium oxysporum f. sp. albedinis]